jgi:hypothetical protein
MQKSLAPVLAASRLASSSLVVAAALGGLVVATGQPVQAAEFSGVCPLLGSTQPAYPSPFIPSVPPDPIALPQTPVWVTPTKPAAFAGKLAPICAVYMSANQSGQRVPAEEVPGAKIELSFPDLTLQPWYHQCPGPGKCVAEDWANSLIANGYWEIPNTMTLGSTHLNWSSDGMKMLVNEKIGNNKNQSNFSPYFLWDIDAKPRKVALNSEVVYYNSQSKKWDNSTENTLDADAKYWYWVLDAPGTHAPGPLPLLGAGAAFGWSRRLRQRVRQAASD